MPDGIADADLRLIRGAPSGPVSTSYAQQAYRVRDEDRVEYVPRPAAEAAAEPLLPDLALPVHLISGWHRDGEPSTYGPNHGGHDALHDVLLGAAYPIVQAGAFPPDQSWYEELLLAGGLSDQQAVDSGRAAGQAAVVRWDSAALTVLPTGLRDDIAPSRSAWQLTRLATRSCPLRLDDDPTGRCQLYGGRTPPARDTGPRSGGRTATSRSVCWAATPATTVPSGPGGSGPAATSSRWPTRSPARGTGPTAGTRRGGLGYAM